MQRPQFRVAVRHVLERQDIGGQWVEIASFVDAKKAKEAFDRERAATLPEPEQPTVDINPTEDLSDGAHEI